MRYCVLVGDEHKQNNFVSNFKETLENKYKNQEVKINFLSVNELNDMPRLQLFIKPKFVIAYFYLQISDSFEHLQNNWINYITQHFQSKIVLVGCRLNDEENLISNEAINTLIEKHHISTYQEININSQGDLLKLNEIINELSNDLFTNNTQNWFKKKFSSKPKESLNNAAVTKMQPH